MNYFLSLFLAFSSPQCPNSEGIFALSTSREMLGLAQQHELSSQRCFLPRGEGKEEGVLFTGDSKRLKEAQRALDILGVRWIKTP